MQLSQIVLQAFRALTLIEPLRQELAQSILRSSASYDSVCEIQLLREQINKEKNIVLLSKKLMKDQLLNQWAARDQLYEFQLGKLAVYISQVYHVGSRKNPFNQYAFKINLLSHKFLLPSYDFTTYQLQALVLYFVTISDSNQPKEADFSLIWRIVQKYTDYPELYHHISVSFRIIIILLENLLQSEKYFQFYQTLKKFPILDKIFQIAQSNKNQYCKVGLDIQLMIKLSNFISFMYNQSDKVQSQMQFNQHQAPSYSEFLDFLKYHYNSLKEFINICVHVVKNNDAQTRAFNSSIKFISNLRYYDFVDFDQAYDLSLNNFEQSCLQFYLNDQQKEISQILRQEKVMEQIMTKPYFWSIKNDSIKQVLQIFQFVVSELSLSEFKDNFIPLVQHCIFDQKELKLDWLFKYIHNFIKPELTQEGWYQYPKKSQNDKLFKEIFIDTNILSKLIDRLDKVGSDLDENVIYMLGNYTWPKKFEYFIFSTMIAIDICKACQINPCKVIRISAEIVLKLRLNCGWLNVLMQDFLYYNPIQEQEKMEIQS